MVKSTSLGKSLAYSMYSPQCQWSLPLRNSLAERLGVPTCQICWPKWVGCHSMVPRSSFWPGGDGDGGGGVVRAEDAVGYGVELIGAGADVGDGEGAVGCALCPELVVLGVVLPGDGLGREVEGGGSGGAGWDVGAAVGALAVGEEWVGGGWVFGGCGLLVVGCWLGSSWLKRGLEGLRVWVGVGCGGRRVGRGSLGRRGGWRILWWGLGGRLVSGGL